MWSRVFPVVPPNLRVLFSLRMVRLFACGLLAVVLVLYLNALGLNQAEIGLLLTLTFFGDAVISFALTMRADRWGRRRTIRVGAALMVLGGVGLALTDNFVLLVLAAMIGVISPTGGEVGPFLAIEQACLSQVTPFCRRTHVFAWYHVSGFSMSAIGALFGGVLAHALQLHGWTAVESYRLLLWVFAGCGAALGLISLQLGRDVEFSPVVPRQESSTNRDILGLGNSRNLVLRLSSLFALDSFAGGFCLQSFVAYWFFVKFGMSEAQLGGIFFGSSLLGGFCGLAAVPLVRRIGLIHTMVWTHNSAPGYTPLPQQPVSVLIDCLMFICNLPKFLEVERVPDVIQAFLRPARDRNPRRRTSSSASDCVVARGGAWRQRRHCVDCQLARRRGFGSG